MKQDNKQTTRELAIEWWENEIQPDVRIFLMQKYFPNSSSFFDTGIEHIYLSEHPQKEETVKGKEVWAAEKNHIVNKELPGLIIASCNLMRRNAEDTAQRIVLCHNVHDELVSALKELIKVATDTTANLCGFDGADELDNSIDKAKELLSRIKQ